MTGTAEEEFQLVEDDSAHDILNFFILKPKLQLIHSQHMNGNHLSASRDSTLIFDSLRSTNRVRVAIGWLTVLNKAATMAETVLLHPDQFMVQTVLFTCHRLQETTEIYQAHRDKMWNIHGATLTCHSWLRAGTLLFMDYIKAGVSDVEGASKIW